MPSSTACQRTLAESITFEGVGVHGGLPSRLSISPAPPDSGIRVSRVFDNGRVVGPLRLTYGLVSRTTLATTLDLGAGTVIATVEHVLSALSGLGVDNALISVDSDECPIMDGSAAMFVEAILSAGLVVQPEERQFIRVLRPVVVHRGDAFALLEPFEGQCFDVEIEFSARAIGRQRLVFDWAPRRFRGEIAPARTFGFWADAQVLHRQGLARGASLANSVLLDGDLVMNPDGLRFNDEFVRHKLLDAMGDLAMGGMPIYGRFRSYRSGHALNAQVLASLLASDDNFDVVSASHLSVGSSLEEDVQESLNPASLMRRVG